MGGGDETGISNMEGWRLVASMSTLETLTKLIHWSVHQSSMEEEAHDREGEQRKGRVGSKGKMGGRVFGE